jgi:hypothetical protein
MGTENERNGSRASDLVSNQSVGRASGNVIVGGYPSDVGPGETMELWIDESTKLEITEKKVK